MEKKTFIIDDNAMSRATARCVHLTAIKNTNGDVDYFYDTITALKRLKEFGSDAEVVLLKEEPTREIIFDGFSSTETVSYEIVARRIAENQWEIDQQYLLDNFL